MGIFKCNRSENRKSETRAVRDPYTNDVKLVSYSLSLTDYDNTYFNTKHIVRFISKNYERRDNYTTYVIVLVYPKNYNEMQTNEFVIEYFDEDERERDLKILIRLIEND